MGVKREQFHCTKVTSTGMVRGVALNLSSSGNNDLALGQVLSEEGAFHWPPKTTILWVLALTLYKSIVGLTMSLVFAKFSRELEAKRDSLFAKI